MFFTTTLLIKGISPNDAETFEVNLKNELSTRAHLSLVSFEKINADYVLKLTFESKTQEYSDKHLQEEVYEILAAITRDSQYSVEIVK